MRKASGIPLAAVAIALCGFVAAESALARGPHRHHHGGARIGLSIAIGVPLFAYGFHAYHAPSYYYPSYYYPPTPLIIQQAPTTYVEQSPQPALQAPASAYWYYCADSRAYYPYVKDCASPWQRVAPQPG